MKRISVWFADAISLLIGFMKTAYHFPGVYKYQTSQQTDSSDSATQSDQCFAVQGSGLIQFVRGSFYRPYVLMKIS